MKVLVVYKKTQFQRSLERADGDLRLRRLAEDSPFLYDRWKQSHEAHQDTMTRVREALEAKNVSATYLPYDQESKQSDWTLAITVGGDGTLLGASHFVSRDQKIVGINSSPETSVGYFCAGERFGAAATIDAAFAGDLKETTLSRMTVSLDGQTLSKRVLNDVLFCHECPASTSRYDLEFGSTRERQVSSGIWIGPAAGSTAAMQSAGGKVLPIDDNRMQFVVREPYRSADLQHTHGLILPRDSLTIHSSMREGRVFLDGSYRMHEIPLGATLEFSRSADTLSILGLRARG